jgi:hypothetical protein
MTYIEKLTELLENMQLQEQADVVKADNKDNNDSEDSCPTKEN